MRISPKSRLFFPKYQTHFAIAYQHFQAAEKYSHGMPIPRTGWDMHHNAQRHFLIQSTAIVATVFSAFTLESFINHYGAINLSEDSFKTLERKSPVEKWKKIPKEILGKTISTDGLAYQNLRWLFEKRDEFAHSKTKVITLGEVFEEKFDRESLGAENLGTVNEARRAINTVREIVDELKQLDPQVDTDWLTDVQSGKHF